MIYADNAATTRMSETARQAMLPYLDGIYGNPSSIHRAGQQARAKLEEARRKAAQVLSCGPREIIFTSGGSESDNQAIFGAARLGAAAGRRHIITTAFEHHAVLHAIARLEKEGFAVTWLDIPPEGIVSPQQVAEAIREDTCLVSVMMANNEIGTIQPIDQIGQVIRDREGFYREQDPAHRILFHVDAVQAAGHLPLDVEALQVDLLAISGHKFHGPKGVGLLYVRKGVRLPSLIEGGAQERNRRGGTENLAGIAGMTAALTEAADRLEANEAYVSGLRDRLIEGLSEIPYGILNGDRQRCLPGIVNFCFEGIEGETLLLMLDERGICASSGSACTSGSLEASHVLLALGRSRQLAYGSLRLSLCETNTAQEVEEIIGAVTECIARLREDAPGWQERICGRVPFELDGEEQIKRNMEEV